MPNSDQAINPTVNALVRSPVFRPSINGVVPRMPYLRLEQFLCTLKFHTIEQKGQFDYLWMESN